MDKTRIVRVNGKEFVCPVFNVVDKYVTKLPFFTGFYQGMYVLNVCGDDVLDMLSDKLPSAAEDYIRENYHDWLKYEDYQDRTSRDVTLIVREYLKEILPDDIFDIEYIKLTSPKEYNFATDEIEVCYQCNFNNIIDRFIEIEDIEDIIKDRWSSCDGFWSFVPNNLSDFLEKIDPEQILSWMLEQIAIDYDRINNNTDEWGIFDRIAETFLDDYQMSVYECFDYEKAFKDIISNWDIWDKVSEKENEDIENQPDIYSTDFEKFNIT